MFIEQIGSKITINNNNSGLGISIKDNNILSTSGRNSEMESPLNNGLGNVGRPLLHLYTIPENLEKQYETELVEIPHYWRDKTGTLHNKPIHIEQKTAQQRLILGEKPIKEGFTEWNGSLYPIQYMCSIARMSECGNYKIPYHCPECDYTKTKKEYCNVKYCSKHKCVEERRIKAHKKLVALGIRNKMFFQFEIGSNILSRDQRNIVVKKFIKKLPNKYKLLKNGKYQLPYVKINHDIGNKNIGITGKPFFHDHIAFTGVKVDAKDFIMISRNILHGINQKCVFSCGGWVKKKPLFNYFAQRVSGELGEAKTGKFYLRDVITLKEYFQMYYRKQSLQYNLNALITCITELPETSLNCPNCKIELIRGSRTPILCETELDSSFVTEEFIGS